MPLNATAVQEGTEISVPRSAVPIIAKAQRNEWRPIYNDGAARYLAKMFPAPWEEAADWLSFGERGRYRVRPGRTSTWKWRDMISKIEGRYFSELVGILLNEPEPDALERIARWDHDIGKDEDRAHLHKVLGSPPARPWLAQWEMARDFRHTPLAKALSAVWGAPLSFSGDRAVAVRESGGKLLTLHTDALTDARVGLTVYGPDGMPISRHGDTAAPVKLHALVELALDPLACETLYLAGDIRTALYAAKAHHPMWICDPERLEIPPGVKRIRLALDLTDDNRRLARRHRKTFADKGLDVDGVFPDRGEPQWK